MAALLITPQGNAKITGIDFSSAKVDVDSFEVHFERYIFYVITAGNDRVHHGSNS